MPIDVIEITGSDTVETIEITGLDALVKVVEVGILSGPKGDPGPPGPPGTGGTGGSGASATSFVYTFSSLNTTPTTSGQVRADTSTPETAGGFFVNPLDKAGQDNTNLILNLVAQGDRFYIQDYDDANSYALFDIVGDPFMYGTDIGIPVSFISKGTNDFTGNKAQVLLAFVEQAPPPEALVPGGGLSGQFLAKFSDTSFDIGWLAPPSGGGTTFSLPIYVNSNYTASVGDDIYVDIGSNDVTITLPPNPPDQSQVRVRCSNVGGGTHTLAIVPSPGVGDFINTFVQNSLLTNQSWTWFTYQDAGNNWDGISGFGFQYMPLNRLAAPIGTINMANNRISNLGDPTGPDNALRLGFADGRYPYKSLWNALGDLVVADVDALPSTLHRGTTGQVLTVDATGILTWTTPSSGGSNIPVASDVIWDAKGDLAVGTGPDTASKLIVGTNGQVLTADSTVATGLRWGTPVTGAAPLTPTSLKTANYTAAAGDDVLCDPSSTAFTVTLPPSPADGAPVRVRIVANSSGNAVTIAPNSGQTLYPSIPSSIADIDTWTSLTYQAANSRWLQTTGIWPGYTSLSRFAAPTVDLGWNNKKLQNLADATNPQDALNLRTADGRYATTAGLISVATDPIWDQKGDLAVGTGADVATRLGVGGDGAVLTIDSSTPTGMKWAGAPEPAGSQAFAYSGGAQSFVVPAGVTTLNVTLYGAQGGTAWYNGGISSVGGAGAKVTGSINVTPGETLQINVGGYPGASGSNGAGGAWQGGFNGGGNGGNFNVNKIGGGGGGASDIRRGGTALANRVAIAAGGGGGGAAGPAASVGGEGGLVGAQPPPGGIYSGQGGTAGAGGAAGSASGTGQTAGTLGQGGAGATTGDVYVGGGGGGGLYGGGGGAAQGGGAFTGWGGGGGSSLVPAAGSALSGQNSGAGSVNLVWGLKPSVIANDTLFDAKGDIIAATADNVAIRVPVGTNNQILTADSTQAPGIKWAAAPIGNVPVASDIIWDAKGDLAVGTGADTASKLVIGTNGQILVVDTTTATGLKWATPSNLVITPIKTSSYTVAAYDFVRVDATAASVPIAVPSNPAIGFQFAVTLVATAGANSSTVTLGGTDRFQSATGPTTKTLTARDQVLWVQYAGSNVWTVIQDLVLPLAPGYAWTPNTSNPAQIGGDVLSDVQTFTTTGAFTWVAPSWVTPSSLVRVQLVGGGGGGGSGRRGAAATLRGGGGGGQAGFRCDVEFCYADLAATVNGQVGLGAAGGAQALADNTDGADGNGGIAGNASFFGKYVYASGGAGGKAGVAANEGAGGTTLAGARGMWPGAPGMKGSGATAAGDPEVNEFGVYTVGQLTSVPIGSGGGGGGAGINASNANVIGSDGGDVNGYADGSTLGGAAGTGSFGGTNGVAADAFSGSGGGGGGRASASNALAGGNGAVGAGGGGGGGALNGFSGGNGGNGGNGIVRVTTRP